MHFSLHKTVEFTSQSPYRRGSVAAKMMWWKMFISSFLSSLWLLAIIPYGYCSIFTWSSSSSSLPLRPIRIGTRGSPLALAQAEETKNLLISKFPKLKNSISIVKIMTQVRKEEEDEE